MKTYYKFKFYLNSKHSVTFNDKASSIHPHTWEIVVLFQSHESETINFTSFENELEQYFLKYEGKYLNDIDYFKNLNPTMENIGKLFYKDINELVTNIELDFIRIEISENPTRTYILEEE